MTKDGVATERLKEARRQHQVSRLDRVARDRLALERLKGT